MKKFFLVYGAFVLVITLTLCSEPGVNSATVNPNAQALNNDRIKALAAIRDSARQTAPVEPQVTSSFIIHSEDDIVGNWVGMFVPTDSLLDIIYDDRNWNFYEFETSTPQNKINLCIDSLVNGHVYGHSVVAGNDRPFEGSYETDGRSYRFNVKEPGDDKYDGTFRFSLNANDSLLKGEWNAYKNIKVPERVYSLKKRVFVYDPNTGLEEYALFRDWTQTITDSVEYREGDEVEVYEEESIFSSTEDAWKLNASNGYLKKEEVENLKKGDIFIIRNTIYARHGYSFENKPLRNFFDRQDWYIPIQTDVRHELTDIELQNIELLLRYEEHAEAYYDSFGR